MAGADGGRLLTGHINRFGHYDLRFDHIPPPMVEGLRLTFAHAVRS